MSTATQSQSLVEWALATIKAQWPDADYPDDLHRINRDESRVLETDERTRSGELTAANYVGVASASGSSTAIGTEYNLRREDVLSVRIEGLHTDEWGHVVSEAAFGELVGNIKRALLTERSYPTLGSEDIAGAAGPVAYHSLFIENETSQHSEHRDYFRTDFDVRTVGYETLPET